MVRGWLLAKRLGTAYLAISIVAGSLALGMAAQRYLRPQASHPPAPSAAVVFEAPSPVAVQPSAAAVKPTPTPTPAPLPPSVFIRVPYTTQAPNGTWDATHQQYCEAAATLMVGRYFRGERQTVITPPEAEKALGQIVTYERETFPGVVDLKLEQMGTVGNYFYDLKPSTRPATLEAVKQSLATGVPVIIPVMTHGAPGGQKIAPGFGARDVYHVILLIGYDQNRIYANDAGFAVGQNWAYSWDILESAMEAQSGRMGQGRMMLTFSQR
jgi:hypothetical protein